MSGPGFDRMKRRLGSAAAEDLRLSVIADRAAALEGVTVEKRKKRAALTAVSVAKYKADPSGKRLEIPDAAAPGLHLVIQPKGAKSWAVRFRGTDGKHVKVTLGPVDLSGATGGTPIRGRPMTLAGARRLAAELMHARESGQHVVARKRRHGSTETFAEAARAFVEEYARPRNRRWRETAKRLGLEPDTLELRPGGLAALMEEPSRGGHHARDIDALIRDVKRRGVPGLNGRGSPHQARGQLRCLSKMFSWLRPHVTTNPCRDLDPAPGREGAGAGVDGRGGDGGLARERRPRRAVRRACEGAVAHGRATRRGSEDGAEPARRRPVDYPRRADEEPSRSHLAVAALSRGDTGVCHSCIPTLRLLDQPPHCSLRLLEDEAAARPGDGTLRRLRPLAAA